MKTNRVAASKHGWHCAKKQARVSNANKNNIEINEVFSGFNVYLVNDTHESAMGVIHQVGGKIIFNSEFIGEFRLIHCDDIQDYKHVIARLYNENIAKWDDNFLNF